MRFPTLPIAGLIWSLVIVVGSTEMVHAQYGVGYNPPPRTRWGARRFPGYPAYGYGAGFAAETPYSANAKGMAALVRARGLAAENVTEAAKNYEQAREQYIKNQLEWHQMREARKDIYDKNVEEKRAENKRKLEALNEYLAKEKAREQREALAAANSVESSESSEGDSAEPLSLTSLPMDSQTGEIRWPQALQPDAFAKQRQALQSLIDARSELEDQTAIDRTISSIASETRDKLDDNVEEFSADDYIDAREFLGLLIR